MRDTGFRLLKIGIEAGTDEGLAKLAKLEGIEKIKRGIRAARDNGLVTLLTTMVGALEVVAQVTDQLLQAEHLLFKDRPPYGGQRVHHRCQPLRVHRTVVVASPSGDVADSTHPSMVEESSGAGNA